MYCPAGVPRFDVPPVLPLLFPHEINSNEGPNRANTMAIRVATFRGLRDRGLRVHSMNTGTRSIVAYHEAQRPGPLGITKSVEAAVVFTVRVEVTGLVLGLTDDGFSEHVGPSDAIGVTEQVNATLLLNPFAELTVIVEVAEPPAVNEDGERAAPLSRKSAAPPPTASCHMPRPLVAALSVREERWNAIARNATLGRPIPRGSHAAPAFVV